MPDDATEKIMSRLDDLEFQLNTLRYLTEWVLSFVYVGTNLAHLGSSASLLALSREDRALILSRDPTGGVLNMVKESLDGINKSTRRSEARERVEEVRRRLDAALEELASKAVIKTAGESGES